MGGQHHPSSSVSPSMESGDMGDIVMADGRKTKRELSQSKRAAQNRAAQVSQPFSFYTSRESIDRNCNGKLLALCPSVRWLLACRVVLG